MYCFWGKKSLCVSISKVHNETARIVFWTAYIYINPYSAEFLKIY